MLSERSPLKKKVFLPLRLRVKRKDSGNVIEEELRLEMKEKNFGKIATIVV